MRPTWSTAAADVYSLGKLLYEISTGRDRVAYPEMPSKVDDTEETPDFLRLRKIIARACEDNPAERYQSATELRDALRALRGEAIS